MTRTRPPEVEKYLADLNDPANLNPPATDAELAWRRGETRTIVRGSLLKACGLVAVVGSGVAVRLWDRHSPFWNPHAPLWLRLWPAGVGVAMIALLTVGQIRFGLKHGRSIQLKRVHDSHEGLAKRFFDAMDEP